MSSHGLLPHSATLSRALIRAIAGPLANSSVEAKSSSEYFRLFENSANLELTTTLHALNHAPRHEHKAPHPSSACLANPDIANSMAQIPAMLLRWYNRSTIKLKEAPPFFSLALFFKPQKSRQAETQQGQRRPVKSLARGKLPS